MVDRLRVIQWGTGNVGKYSLRGALTHPELELVGLVVSSPMKEGRDAGELCGLPPAGVTASRDVDAALALDADCVLYMWTEINRPDACLDDIRRILASGKNVVSPAMPRLIWPDAMGPEVRESIEEACRLGQSTYLCTGIEPGFMGDVLPLVLSSLASEIKTIRVREILNDQASYNEPNIMTQFGFMKTPEQDEAEYVPGSMVGYFGSILYVLADGLGVKLDEVRETREVAVSPFGFQASFGYIEKGMIAGVHNVIEGIVDGEVRVVNEHYNILHPDCTPDWPQPALGAGGYEVFIDAIPYLEISLQVGRENDNAGDMAAAATAYRCLNAVAPVCAASPGLKSHAEVAPISGKMVRSWRSPDAPIEKLMELTPQGRTDLAGLTTNERAYMGFN